MNILFSKKFNCKNCYRCIRHCPVKSIRFSDGEAHIIQDECILCGQCYVECPQNAKEIRRDFPAVIEEIEKGKTVIASVAPSFISSLNVNGIESLRDALRRLGFADAFETAEGAQAVKLEYERMVREKTSDIIISSCCHTVNTLIQKYYPAALKYLAPVATPMHAHADILHDKFPDSVVVFIGPCISKKAEMKECLGPDYVLTFDELYEWLEQKGVELEKSDDVACDEKYRSRFFPKAGGILDSMTAKSSTDFVYYSVDGTADCIEVLKNIDSYKQKNVFIEMSACKGGCINGPVARSYKENRLLAQRRVDEYAGDFTVGDKALDTSSVKLEKTIDYTGVHQQMPGKDTIKTILKKMGKTLPEHELNCQSCGYPTCYDKAVAIYMGKADLTMCLPYLKEKAESFSGTIINTTPNGIIAIDDDLSIIEINNAACRLFNLRRASDVLKTSIAAIMNPMDILTVMDSGNDISEKQVYLSEYGKYVEESIVYDKEYHITILILKDITEKVTIQDEHNELCLQTVEVADRVIQKQMRVVQEIASLLGETTAETQIALTKLKDAFLK